MRQTRRGFTLIELLVVISIIAVLVGLLLPAVQAAREASRRAECQNNMKQLGLALQSYHATHRTFPAGGYNNPATGIAETSWFPGVLPYLDQQNLANIYNSDIPYYDPSQATAVGTVVKTMRCPSDVGPDRRTILKVTPSGTSDGDFIAGVSSYQACSGIAPELATDLLEASGKFPSNSQYQTVFWRDPDNRWKACAHRDIQDGSSNTILLMETHGLGHSDRRTHFTHTDPYLQLYASPFNPYSTYVLHGVNPDGSWPGPLWGLTNGSGTDAEPYSYHTGKINVVAMADGSVRTINPNNVPLYLLAALLVVNDQQVVNLE